MIQMDTEGKRNILIISWQLKVYTTMKLNHGVGLNSAISAVSELCKCI